MRRMLLAALVVELGLYVTASAVCGQEHTADRRSDAAAHAAAPEEQAESADADENAVMVEVAPGEMPSDEEWQALHEDTERAGMLGGLADFKSKVIAHMNTRYFTANPADGTIASYGKMGDDKRYDRFGQIDGVEFDAGPNSWRQHFVVDGKALLKLAGSRFMEFCGLGVDAAADKTNKIEVTFIGTALPKEEAIRCLNADVQALEYFDALENKRAQQAGQKKFKLFGDDAPPAPKVVLANVVMVDGNFSKALDTSVNASLKNRVSNDSVELKLTTQNGEQITLLSPVVRCYRTYSVEFKTGPDGRPMRVSLADRNGNVHQVPQVFDLTPDL